MRTRVFAFVAVFLFAMLSGCGTVGKDFNHEMVPEIKNNATNKTHILNWFGVPFKEGKENGHSMWTYQYDKYAFGETKSKDLVILFDEQGVVKSYRYTSNMDSE